MWVNLRLLRRILLFSDTAAIWIRSLLKNLQSQKTVEPFSKLQKALITLVIGKDMITLANK